MKVSGFYSRYGKRFLDVIIAGAALSILSPVLALTAALVRWKLGSPILFKQLRPGRYGAPFVLLKFRTMLDQYDAGGHLLPDLKRQTSIGNFLRRSSLDELPELLNVIRGEMSLVGPRPLLIKYLPRYTPEQMCRHDVLPGITGWAQVNGRNLISWEEKFRLDLWYVRHCSLRLDSKILFQTLRKVLEREGISAPAEFSSREFNPDAEPVSPEQA
ncbi:MAG TPA: sugar transferase [Chthoniobacteraceae bacterium]|nr:sugar transferase [Chthoniobacteraceae bacterium]